MDSQFRLDVGDLKLGGRRFAPADSLRGAMAFERRAGEQKRRLRAPLFEQFHSDV